MADTHTTDAPLVFAAAPYLNAAPLTEGFRARTDVRLVTDVPSRLARHVMCGEADVGLVPVVDYIFTPELAVLGELGVGADGPVSSVLLRCRAPVADVRAVAADPASHTSNLLAQLLLRTQLGSGGIVRRDVKQGEGDGDVVIGDRALAVSSEGGVTVYDLADLWKTMTTLPFVFAVWACRRDNPRIPQLAAAARESFAVGAAAMDTLAARFAARLDLPVAVCRDYLQVRIRYHVGATEREAVARFEQLLRAHDLAPKVSLWAEEQ